MGLSILSTTPATPSSVEPLVHRKTGDVMGYRITGAGDGPRALATGYRGIVSEAFHRLAQLPGLPELKGELILVFAEVVDGSGTGLGWQEIFDDTIDGSVFVSLQEISSLSEELRMQLSAEVYWSVLRLCAELGMIDGRGLPAFESPELGRYIQRSLTPREPWRK